MVLQKRKFQRRGEPTRVPFPVSCGAETPLGLHHGTVTVETENQEPFEFWFQIEVGQRRSPPVSPARSPQRPPREVGQSTRPTSAAADANRWRDSGEPDWVPPAPPQTQTITELIERESLQSTAPRFHFFLGHRQVGGGAQVGEIDSILTHRLGLRCWRDLSQRVQDVNSMIRGVAESSVYLLYLTSDALSFFVTIEARAAMMLGKPVVIVMENDKRKPSYAGGKVEVATASWPADLNAYFRTGRFVTWGGEPCEWSIADQDAKLRTILEQAETRGPAVPGGMTWAGALQTLSLSPSAALRSTSSHSFERRTEPMPEPEPAEPEPEKGHCRQLCFSYASQGNARVEEAKTHLESRGWRVFWGLDVRTMAGKDWRNQWMLECQRADACVNFLSVAYIQSQACADEWNYAKKNREPSRVLNVVVGGAKERAAILAVPLEGKDCVASRGGAAIQMHFTSDGQALSVYAKDSIAEKIERELATLS